MKMPNRIAGLLHDVGSCALVDARSLGGKAHAAVGAYLLVIRLPKRATFRIRATCVSFEPGWYLYAGSAYGPGGIAARLRRHFMREKKIHWHVDHLTTSGNVIAAATFPDGRECDLIARLAASGHCTFAQAGFGSSDCRNCRSHVIHVI